MLDVSCLWKRGGAGRRFLAMKAFTTKGIEGFRVSAYGVELGNLGLGLLLPGQKSYPKP